MKCPKCQHDMVQSKAGWLCLSCGYAETIKPVNAAVVPAAAPTVDPITTPQTSAVPAAKTFTDLAPVPSDDKPKNQLSVNKRKRVKSEEAEAKPAPVAEPSKVEAVVAAPAADAMPAGLVVESNVKPDVTTIVKDDKPETPVTPDKPADAPVIEESAKPVAQSAQSLHIKVPVTHTVDHTPSQGLPEAKSEDKPVVEKLSATDSKDSAIEAATAAAAAVTATESEAPSEALKDEAVDKAADTSVDDSKPADADKPEVEPVVESTEPHEPEDTTAKIDEPVAVVAETAAVEAVADHEADAKADEMTKQTAEIDAPIAAAPLEAAAVADIVSADKQPLVAKTHPRPSSQRRVAIGVTGVVLVVAALLIYGFMGPQRPLKSLFHHDAAKATAVNTVATATPLATDAPSPSVSPSPSPTTAPAVDSTADNQQRQSDLTKYVAAYKATASNGYYSTTPPAVSVNATDPTTKQPYMVQTTAPTSVGQIYYQAGGRCGLPPVTPGKTETKYIALQTILEGQTTPYCVDVQ